MRSAQRASPSPSRRPSPSGREVPDGKSRFVPLNRDGPKVGQASRLPSERGKGDVPCSSLEGAGETPALRSGSWRGGTVRCSGVKLDRSGRSQRWDNHRDVETPKSVPSGPLFLRESVSVRGHGILLSLRLWTIPGTVELCTTMGKNLRVPRRFSRTRVCDPQQLRTPPSLLVIPMRVSLPTCCGSQSRAPERESVTRSNFAPAGLLIVPTPASLPTCCGSQSRAPLVAAWPCCESSGKAGRFLGRL